MTRPLVFSTFKESDDSLLKKEAKKVSPDLGDKIEVSYPTGDAPTSVIPDKITLSPRRHELAPITNNSQTKKPSA